MIHKIFNPLFGNFDAHSIDEILKIRQLLIFKRLAPWDGLDNYLGNFAVGNEYFGPALKLLIAAMNMDRFMLVGPKEEYDSKIIKNFRLGIDISAPGRVFTLSDGDYKAK